MLSPRSFRLLLRHFDSLDRATALKLTRKTPWQETALTAFFCDLLDEDAQAEENIGYTLTELRSDLLRSDEPVSVNFKIEAHQYPAYLEHYVTQADFGLVINYIDQFDASQSTTTPWLMQAKRIFPTKKTGIYDVNSRFESYDKDQHARMKKLEAWAGEPFVRYFLYCPRPEKLDKPVREALSHARTQALSGHLFDGTLGLELRDDLLSSSSTISAGLLVADIDATPSTLVETHAGIFRQTMPFSWFVIQHLADNETRHRLMPYEQTSLHDRVLRKRSPTDQLMRIVRGDHRVVDDVNFPDWLKESSPRILPAHTIEVSIVSGTDRPRND